MKDKIIKESLHRFSIDGYYNTSMQSIAENCGISKASLYKYFASKEDLLLQAFEYNLEQMLLRATTLQVDPQKSPREQLIEKIVSELESTKEHRPFMHLVLRTAPPKKNAELMSMFKRTRALLMNWHYDSLEQMYKGSYRGNLWDLVVMFQGTLREYTSLMVDEHKSLNSHDVAHKVVEFVEAAAPVQFTNQALLSEEMMNDYATYRSMKTLKALKHINVRYVGTSKTRSKEKRRQRIVPNLSMPRRSLLRKRLTTIQDSL